MPDQADHESLVAKLFRHPLANAITVVGAIGSAFQIAGVTSMPLASLTLLVGVWLFLVGQVWFSRWIHKTGRYKSAIMCALILLSGAFSIWIGEIIMQRQKAVREEHQRAEILSHPTEGLWVRVSLAVNEELKVRFREKAGPYLNAFGATGLYGSSSPWPLSAHDAAWESTFGSFMPCDPSGLGSSIRFDASESPSLGISIHHMPVRGACTVISEVGAMTGVELRGDTLDNIGYHLEFPINRESMGVFVQARLSTLRHLLIDSVPTWKAFVIDKPSAIPLSVFAMTCANRSLLSCGPSASEAPLVEFKKKFAQDFEKIRPRMITVKVEPLTQGSAIIKEYVSMPGPDPSVTEGSVRYNWKLSRYDEVPGEYRGGPLLPPSKDLPRGRR